MSPISTFPAPGPLAGRRINVVSFHRVCWFGWRMVSWASWVDWEIGHDAGLGAVTLRRRRARQGRVIERTFAVPMTNVRYMELETTAVRDPLSPLSPRPFTG